MGVRVARTSATGAKAETIRLTGEVVAYSTPSVCQLLRMDMESLPTGMQIPSAWQSALVAATAW
jgi:hypothetical protein